MFPRHTSEKIAPGMRTSDAFRQIMQDCLWYAAIDLPLIGKPGTDATHQTRVGLRRARSGLVLFKRMLDRDERKACNHQLRETGRRLAPSRDWDVFIEKTLPKLVKREKGLDQLCQLAYERRRIAYKTVSEQQAVLAADIIRWFVLKLVKHGDEPIEVIAPDLLDRMYFCVRYWCRHTSTMEERHALRKAVKRLRYSVEFLSGLYDAKMVKSFIHHCKQAQEVLGKMNDACTMIRLLNELGTYPTLVEWGHHQQHKAESQLAKAITDFRSAKLFWD